MRSLSTALGRNGARLLPLLLASLIHATPALSQVVAEPILAGQAFVGDTVLDSGMVTLHRMTAAVQGEIDSVPLAPDGSFIFRLPSVPDETAGDMYLASLQHDGVTYFGSLISRAVDLDTLYEIHAYDTIVAPPEGLPVALEARSIFFEPSGAEWAITDVFQLRNDRDRTIVPEDGGPSWSYPLPAGARDVGTVQGMAPDLITQDGDQMVYHGPVQPGQGPFLVVRYFVDSLAVTIPTPGETEVIDLLVREPAPAIRVEGLVQDSSYMSDGGVTYRRFAGQGLEIPELRITMAEDESPPPVQWIAVVLALVLLGGGLLALKRAPSRAVAPAGGEAGGVPAQGRQAILVEIARLDDDYEREESPSAARTREYRRRRTELMGRLKGLG